MATTTTALLLLLGLAAALLAGPACGLRAMEGGRVSVPREGWTWAGRAPDSHPLTLYVALKHRNVDVLERVVLEVSDPDSPAYGEHLSMEAANALVEPRFEHKEAARRWLAAAGVDEARVAATSHGDFLVVDTSAEEAGRLLGGVEYHLYRAQSGRTVARLAPGHSYALPDDAAEAIDFVAPSVLFPRAKQQGPMLNRPRTDDVTLSVTAGFLLELYGVPNTTDPTIVPSNWQAVVSFISQFFRPADVSTYQALFANYTSNNISSVFGKNDPSSPGDEAALDTEILPSVGFNVNTSVFYNGNEDTPFLSWLVIVNNMTSIPSVFSISYGDNENALSYAYASRSSAEFAKLAARGVSVLIAAGDSGVGGNCSASGVFSPDWPATVPTVTTVGGAAFGTPGHFPTGETVDLIGGGGFSDFYPRPSWQNDAIGAYLNSTKLPPAKLWNATGRGYPDVAAQSEGFVIVLDGIPIPFVGGTSCATPTVSGIVSLLNNLRLRAGKPPLGFLNPLIYKNGPTAATGFSDIVSGQNEGCTLAGGFNAAKGWDAASGWGSPNYARLAKVVESLPR